MKKIIALFLAFLISASSIPATFSESDEPSNWSVRAIEALRDCNQFRDVAFQNYKDNITRLDFIYIAVRVYELLANEEITVDSNISFTDTDDIYALKGARIGLTSGIGGGKFGGQDLLTREQLATLMVKLLKLLDINMEAASQDIFGDDRDISDWAKSSIYLAKSNKIISGVGNNCVNPKGTASTEMAMMIAYKILLNNNYWGDNQTSISETAVNTNSVVESEVADVEPVSVEALRLTENKGRYSLAESSNALNLWTDYPSEHIFKDDSIPSTVDSGLDVYLAQNEFEPFQVVVRPVEKTAVTVQIGQLPNGLSLEMHEVAYVYLDEATDSLGRSGWYPDPLYPRELNTSIEIEANENTPLWFTFKSDKTIAAGDYTISLEINDIEIPVRVHVFDFAIPETLHVKSQINLSTNAFLEKYGVSGTSEAYWEYVDRVKQFMIDHRLTPKSVLWSGGLTSGGGAPFRVL